MELGQAPEPAWLKAYITEKNEKLIRRKFDIRRNQALIVGYGNSSSLDTARTASQIDAQNQLYNNIGKKKSIRFVFLYEYWFEDSDSGYNVYSIYCE